MLKKIMIGALTLILLSACGAPKTVNEMSMTMSEFHYAPSAITVMVGQPVSLTLINAGAIEHDFVVERIDVSSVSSGGDAGEHHMKGEHGEYDLHTSVEAGGESVLVFTANQPGTYKIFCSVEGHEEAGMVAELIVVSE